MLVYKSALLFFTTLALGTAVQGIAIQDPVARELSILNGNVALDIRGNDLADMGLNQKLLEREPKRKPKAASPATINLVKQSANQVETATNELKRFRATHKKAVKKTKSWFGRENEERDAIEERASKAKNTEDLRKTLRKVNQHLLIAANNLRQVRRREVGADVVLEKRLAVPIPIVTSIPIVSSVVPVVTDVVSSVVPVVTDIPVVTDVVPVVTDVVSSVVPVVTDVVSSVVPVVTDVVPVVTDVLSSVVPVVTDVVPVVTDVLSSVVPVVTDVLPSVTDILPSVTLPSVTLPLPTDVLPSVTDVLPSVTLPSVTLPSVTLPSVTLPLPTDSTTTTTTTPAPTTTVPPIGGLAAILAAIRALIALLRALIRELIAAIRDIFSGDVTDPTVLSEVSPGLGAIFSAISDLANEISPSIGAIVDPILNGVRSVLSSLGFNF
ncbi:hypothetical protein OC842_001651 [Tilletia horrida]|uniref:Uncharacterized protein n=1 Tax=Tilletia horrida TaxID=155126 RepID=A0AAN6JM13_9BASI|nr:hypothetical protein OC842_001651 [Tilletia horrida]